MKLNKVVTWIESANRKSSIMGEGDRSVRIITGIIIDAEGSLEEREYLVQILKISGPDPAHLTDKVWIKESELRRWPSHERDHFVETTPFERLLQRNKAMKLKHKREKKRLQSFIADMSARRATARRRRQAGGRRLDQNQ